MSIDDRRIRESLDRQRREREVREEAEREALEEAGRLNEEARRRRLAGEAELARKAAARREAETEAGLAPEKERERRAWLAAHPGQTPEDFERQAWPHLRRNLLDTQAEAQQAALRQRLGATGRYGF